MAQVRCGHCATFAGKAAAARYKESSVHTSSSVAAVSHESFNGRGPDSPGLMLPPPDQLTVMVVSVFFSTDSESDSVVPEVSSRVNPMTLPEATEHVLTWLLMLLSMSFI